MPVLVMKFGGTSVATLDRIKRAAKRVGVEVSKGYDVIVIVSAMSGETNKLVDYVDETSPLYDAREYDAVVSSGENVTAGLMALTLQEMDVPARSWQGWQVPLLTTDAHAAARIEDIPPENIMRKFGEGMKVAVVAGFQGIGPDGRITTLGRGGSDLTAIALAAAAVSGLALVFRGDLATFSPPRLLGYALLIGGAYAAFALDERSPSPPRSTPRVYPA